MGMFLAVLAGCSGFRPIQDAPRAIFSEPCTMTHVEAQCADGVTLTLRRFRAKNRAKPVAVVLCHGIGFNGKIFDLDDQHSLARYLGGEGLDVWVPDLRGAGLSAHCHSTSKPPRGPMDWTIEDYVAQDAPAILATVWEAQALTTDRPRIVWVGHNLGAVIGLAFAAAHPEESGISVVALGANVVGQQPYPPVLADEARSCERLMDPHKRFPALFGSRSPDVPKGWEALFYNPEQMSQGTLAAMARSALSPVPPRVAREFVAMLRGGELQGYAARMSKVKCPALFMCGKADNLADTGSARKLYQSVSSADKGFRLFGLMNSDGADFGNADLLLGPRAGVDVYPEILRWANERP